MHARPLLVFDLDDTLISSFPGYVELHQRVATDLGWEVPSQEALIPYGVSWEATLADLWPNRELAPFFARYEEIADDLPYPAITGVQAALEHLRARDFSLWIITKRTRRRLAQRMRDAGIDATLFDGIFTREEQPAAKPDPRCFAPIWERVAGRPPAVYVGDRHEDQRAAAAAGLAFVAVRTGPEATADWVDTLDPRDVLASAATVPEWLERHQHRVMPPA